MCHWVSAHFQQRHLCGSIYLCRISGMPGEYCWRWSRSLLFCLLLQLWHQVSTAIFLCWFVLCVQKLWRWLPEHQAHRHKSPTSLLHSHGLSFTRCRCWNLCFWHKPSELAHSFSFCSCDCFCLFGPFNCISFNTFSRQLSAFFCSCVYISLMAHLTVFHSINIPTTLRFLTLFFRSPFCLIGPFSYNLFMKVSFSPDIILCGWLDIKASTN